MTEDESYYVIKSSAGLYYRETACRRYWVSDVTKAAQYLFLFANVKKAEIIRRYPNQLQITLEKVVDNG